MVVVESIQTNLIEVVSPNRISGLALAFVRARRNCRLKRIADRGPAPLLQRLAASNPLYVGYLWRSRPTETYDRILPHSRTIRIRLLTTHCS
jgi:hypothetical protein